MSAPGNEILAGQGPLYQDFGFEYDATTFRVRARVTAALPDPDKGLRKLAITGP